MLQRRADRRTEVDRRALVAERAAEPKRRHAGDQPGRDRPQRQSPTLVVEVRMYSSAVAGVAWGPSHRSDAHGDDQADGRQHEEQPAWRVGEAVVELLARDPLEEGDAATRQHAGERGEDDDLARSLDRGRPGGRARCSARRSLAEATGAAGRTRARRDLRRGRARGSRSGSRRSPNRSGSAPRRCVRRRPATAPHRSTRGSARRHLGIS